MQLFYVDNYSMLDMQLFYADMILNIVIALRGRLFRFPVTKMPFSAFIGPYGMLDSI